MDFKELALARHSVRAYSQQKIEPHKIEYILDCARLAPSGVNKQPWHFYVVKSREAREKVQQCYDRPWFRTAPVYIVVAVDPAEAWTRSHDGKNHADIDGSIAAEHLCLAAASIGLGSCWVCNFDPSALATSLGIPVNHIPMAIVPIGYPDEATIKPSQRKPLCEITTEF